VRLFFVERELSPLPECLLAAVDSAEEWPRAGVGIFVLFPVLVKSEFLLAMLAHIVFLVEVDDIVAFQGELGGECFFAIPQVTAVLLFLRH